jgi:transcriptional regulator
VTYRPPYFRVDEPAKLLPLIAAYPLATLVTLSSSEPSLTHLPMLAERDDGTLYLRGHIARANDQWRAGDGKGIALFRIAQHHVTPSWYATKREHGRVVPTFDYVAVEARGPVRFIHDRDWLLSFVRRLTDTQEARVGSDWRVEDAPADYLEKQLAAIVGVEMRVDTIIGTFKLNQNHPEENIAGILAGLEAIGTPEARLLGRFVEEASVSIEGARGFGGIFLRADSPRTLTDWYSQTFGLEQADFGGMILRSRDLDGRDAETVFAFFSRDDDYFPVTQPVMLNLRVSDLDAVLADLRSKGVRVAEERQDEANGRFAWCFDPEGNRIELWEPRA